nr:immunoglobulin light chain junction region [Macaca mulatta]MOW58402.1 immunoglobulin light chain junction region [Macaca mulatta]MOW60249.1 immunoglobulin light chain junction region [Macaca mulatta]
DYYCSVWDDSLSSYIF